MTTRVIPRQELRELALVTEAEATVNGRIDRTKHGDLMEAAVYNLIDVEADVVAVAKEMAKDYAARAVGGRRGSKRLRWSDATHSFNWHDDSVITVGNNVDVLVSHATYADWQEVNASRQKRLRNSMDTAARWQQLVDSLAPLYATHGDMRSIVDSDSGAQLALQYVAGPADEQNEDTDDE